MKKHSTNFVVWSFALALTLGYLASRFYHYWLRDEEVAVLAELMVIPLYMLGGALGGYFYATGMKRRGE